MTKLVWMAIGAVCIGGNVGCTGGERDESDQAADVEPGRRADSPQARDVFTLDMTKQILGDSAKQSAVSTSSTTINLTPHAIPFGLRRSRFCRGRS